MAKGTSKAKAGAPKPEGWRSQLWLWAVTGALVLLTSADLAAPHTGPGTRRTVMAWATGSPAAAAQLRNESWAGVIDGVQAYCGLGFGADGRSIELDPKAFAGCAELIAAAKATGARIFICLGAIPRTAIENPAAAVASAVRIAEAHGLDGFSIDDETDCAPRSTLSNFTSWAGFVDAFADGLHAHGLELSAAVQAMFGIEDVPYAPKCQPVSDPGCSQSCVRAPWEYKAEPRVTALMAGSKIDRWLVMDTYYFGTGRFLNALDWYTGAVGVTKLGVAVMNRADITDDGYLARFHAIERSGADWINIFALPAADQWLPFLRRWKTRCQGCGVQSVLGCYELSIPCA